MLDSSVHRQVFMESSSLFITPKRKSRTSNNSSGSAETSPEEKKWKESRSPACLSDKSSGDDEVMAALNLTGSVTEKLDLILSKLISLDSRFEELNQTVKGIQDKVSNLETEVTSVKDREVSRWKIFTQGRKR